VPDKKVRLFVAIDIPNDIRDLISKATAELEATIIGARWVKPENLHLTLKFIGYYDPEKMERLTGEVHQAAERGPGFRVRFGEPGAFPSNKRARVIWIAMAEGSREAGNVASKLDARLEKVGVKREGRPFAGHLTLARLKQPFDSIDYLENLGNRLDGLQDMAFDVSEIILYESILSPKGPTYKPLERMRLGGKQDGDS
jgi:RNA 2',3'-cyclic 3'-phosphodiesterase